MSIKITLDVFYKTSFFAGIAIILASALISWKHYQATELSTSGILEQIILTRLDIISLSEQRSAILNSHEFSNESTQDGQETLTYTTSQTEQLKQEENALKIHIGTASAKLKELEALKDATRNTMGLFIALTVVGFVFGSLLTIIGCFGWVYHIKIYQERRDQDRDGEKNESL